MLTIDLDRIAAVLLADGWHQVTPGTFEFVTYKWGARQPHPAKAEFQRMMNFLGKRQDVTNEEPVGGDEHEASQATNGATFAEVDSHGATRSVICPVASAILAVSYAPAELAFGLA